ncbi:hypothetical protein KFE98_02105 [bacterium SCSIO 12741]|nr:hypothetical protein KFE98_02105 [bacterium SCSIO 12741]
MKTYHWIILLFLGMMASAWITHTVSQPEIDREPYWHPFELNPNLNLKALVDDGYRCVSMPCGQPQFVKTIGDTSIQYDVSSLTCSNQYYDLVERLLEQEREEFNSEFLSDFVEIDPAQDTVESIDTNKVDPENPFAQEISKNPYFPYIYDDIKDCEYDIHWRVFSFKMDSLDSLGVADYIRSKGGYPFRANPWSPDEGGIFWAHFAKTGIYFRCHVVPEYNYEMDSILGYEFQIIREIPLLDRNRLVAKEKRGELTRYVDLNE